jgi:hypothetical protein
MPFTMKITEIEGYETLATAADLKELRTEMRDQFKALELSIREWRVEVKEQFQRIRLLIWLPVIAAIAQILFAIFKH